MELSPIGCVVSPVGEAIDDSWGEIVSEILINENLAGGLEGIEEFSHLLIVYHMHRSDYQEARHLLRRPRDRKDLPRRGIFAQRARHRPNPLGVTAVELLARRDNTLRVRGLDAVDGSPVLDIKPYVPAFDRVQRARVPGWMDELMKGYF